MDIKTLKTAYNYLAQLLAEAISELRKDKKEVIDSLNTAKDEIKGEIITTNDTLSDASKEIYKKLDEAVEAIKNNKDFNLTNVDEIKNDIVAGLTAVSDTLRSEIIKLDKDIVINTDLEPLLKAISKNDKAEKADNTQIVKILQEVAKKIPVLTESTDYTLILDDIATALEGLEKKEIAIDLSKAEKSLVSILEALQEIKPFEIPKKLIKDDRVKIDISEEQLKKMGGAISVATGGGNSAPIVAAVNAASTSITDAVNASGGAIGEADPNNSSTTPLGISGVFTGTLFDTKDYVTVNVAVYSDVASATDGLCIDWSLDGTNWDITECHSVSAGVATNHLSRSKARYCRVRYTNGGTGQTTFRLATLFKKTAVSHTFEALSSSIDDGHDAALVRSVLAAKKPNQDYINIDATAGGNLKVSIEEQNGTADLATETTQLAILAASGGGAYTTRYDEGATYTYIGAAAVGSATASAVWQIKRMTNSDLTIIFADGDSLYNNIWDNRASLTYI